MVDYGLEVLLIDDVSWRKAKLRTIVAQASRSVGTPENGLASPISLAVNYTRGDGYAYPSEHVYGRADNPTLHETENLIAALECADSAMLFGSGMAAAIALVMALAHPAHVLASTQMYYALRRWLAGISRFGHSITFVDTSDLQAVRNAITAQAPSLVWIETPSNPLWLITDIAAVAEIAHEAGAVVCVDSTVATPVLTRPLNLGADLVMHSATKYLNGHSDVSAGVLAAARPCQLWSDLAEMRSEQGAALGAFEAWLLARGLRTIDLRVHAQSKSALDLATRLQNHPSIKEVFYPGLVTHLGHETAKRQMIEGFGGMISLSLRDGVAAAIKVASTTQLWKQATSLGGIESLIEHRASMEGSDSGCPHDLVRLSVGIEDVNDLYEDLNKSLNALA